MSNLRIPWDEVFMGQAVLASRRATCLRRKVGALITLDNKVLATGYNGSIKGEPHCTEFGCEMENEHCVRTIHAEVNAVLQLQDRPQGMTLYTTASPCWPCMKILAQLDFKRICYLSTYPDKHTLEFCVRRGIETVRMDARKLGIADHVLVDVGLLTRTSVCCD